MSELGALVEEVEFPDVAKPETDSDGDTVLSSEDSAGAFSENADSDGAAGSETTWIFSFNILKGSSAGQHGDTITVYQPGLRNLLLLASWLPNLSLNLDPSHRP